MRRFINALMILSLLFIIFAPRSIATQQQGFNFKQEEYDGFSTTLEGNWLFFEGEHLRPATLEEHMKNNEGEVIYLPHKLANTADFGTFTTEIKLSNDFIGKRMKFFVPFQFSAYKLYVNDRLTVQNGYMNHSITQQNFDVKPLAPSFIVTDTNLRVTLQIAGFKSVNGGLSKKIHFGSEKVISDKIDRTKFMQAFLVGIIILVGVIAMLIYMYKKHNRQFLAFSLFCFSSALWGLFTDSYLYTTFYDGFNWNTTTRITYILPLLVMMFYMWYISISFRNVLSKTLLAIFVGFIGALIVICLYVENGMYQQIYLYLNALLTPFYIYFLVKTAKNVNWKDKTEIFIIIGILLVFISAVRDMYLLATGIDGQKCTFITIALFIVAQSFLNSRRFAMQWIHIEKLNVELTELTESLDEKVKTRTKQLERNNEKLQSLAFLDGLTGVFNRHYFNKNLENLFNKNLETGDAIGIFILDVDEFKNYNDYYGHVNGDRLLKKLVGIISEPLPKCAELTRYGGEEFAILLDHATEDKIRKLGEAMRKAVEDAQLEHLGRKEQIVTISIGCVLMKNAYFDEANEPLSKADEQLYISKNNGRNQFNFIDLG